MPRLITMFLVLSVGCCLSPAAVRNAIAQPSTEAPDAVVRIADFGLEEQVPSAIDLVGPEHGSAGRNRALLAHRVQCWIDGIERCSVADRNDPRVLTIRRFLGMGPADQDGEVIVHFPDETRIAVRLVRATDPGPDALMESAYAPVVQPASVQAPGLARVPSQPDHLEGFAYDVTPAIRAALDRLLQRFEMPVAPAYVMHASEM